MTMTLEEARQAIVGRMRTFNGIAHDRIQYPNAPGFNVPVDGLWCRLNTIGGSSFISGIADVPNTRRTGTINIQCFARIHTGEKSITELCDALLAHFEYFTKKHLECLQGNTTNAGIDNNFLQYNVIIGYRIG